MLLSEVTYKWGHYRIVVVVVEKRNLVLVLQEFEFNASSYC